jgi:hypothetical protein
VARAGKAGGGQARSGNVWQGGVFYEFATVAQMEEHRFCTPVVVGSIPASGCLRHGMGGPGTAVPGKARCGSVWRGMAIQGKARFFMKLPL